MSGVMGLKKTFLGHQLVDKARPCHFVFNLQLVWFLFFFYPLQGALLSANLCEDDSSVIL